MNIKMHVNDSNTKGINLLWALFQPKNRIVGIKNSKNIPLWICIKGRILGKFQIIDNGNNLYYITDVGTKEEFREKKLTRMYFSWIALYLMLKNRKQDFTITLDVIPGWEAYNINSKHGKFVYRWFFKKGLETVDLIKNEADVVTNASRVFLLDNRKKEFGYFIGKYFEAIKVFKKNLTSKTHATFESDKVE